MKISPNLSLFQKKWKTLLICTMIALMFMGQLSSVRGMEWCMGMDPQQTFSIKLGNPVLPDCGGGGGGDPPTDTTPPTVSITSPANGLEVLGTVEVLVDAQDASGINYVKFYVDGSYKYTDYSSPYKYSWDTTSYELGEHTVKAKAYDKNSNSAYDTNTYNISPITEDIPLTSSGGWTQDVYGIASADYDCDYETGKMHTTAIVTSLGGAQAYCYLTGSFIAPKSTLFNIDIDVLVRGVVQAWGDLSEAQAVLRWEISQKSTGAVLNSETIFADTAGGTDLIIPLPIYHSFNHHEYGNAGLQLTQGTEYEIKITAYSGVGSLNPTTFRAESDFKNVDDLDRFFDIQSLTFTYEQ